MGLLPIYQSRREKNAKRIISTTPLIIIGSRSKRFLDITPIVIEVSPKATPIISATMDTIFADFMIV